MTLTSNLSLALTVARSSASAAIWHATAMNLSPRFAGNIMTGDEK